MKNYNNLVDGINDLRTEGYTEDFNLRQTCIECKNGEYKIFHDEFHIEKYFRFDGSTSDPDDESILYAISSEKYNVKGVLVNGYGRSSEPMTNEMVQKLKIG